MPSIVSGFEYDIFISYRHKDNKSDGWVTEFVRTLRSELEATFKEDISIYFDENPNDGLLQHHEVDDSLKEKLRCLILIPIVSQTYCDPKAFAWQHELLVFIRLASEDKLGLKTKVGGGNTASRVLPVRIHEVDARDKKLFEDATGGIMRPIDFIYKESGVNRPLRPSDNRDRNQVQTDYRNQVNKVANAIKDILSGLQGTGEIVTTAKISDEERGSAPTPRVLKPKRKWRVKFPEVNSPFGFAFGVIASLAFIAMAILYFSQPAPDQPTYRYTIQPPEKVNFNSTVGGHIALSPDGRLLAFVALDSAGKALLWVRPLHALTAQALDGTEDASFPFWSPDSRFIGFFAGGKLKKVDAAGGLPQIISDAPLGRGGSWSSNGTIIFCPINTYTSLFRVSAMGGTPARTTKLDSGFRQISHRWPHFLPDGEHFIYLGFSNTGDRASDAIFLGSLDSTFTPRILVNSVSSAAYANGHLLFAREQTLMAQPFDTKRLQTTGDMFPVAERLYFLNLTGNATFTVSQNGILAYQTSEALTIPNLLWYDRMGKKTVAIDQSNIYNDLRLSPDGKRIAFSLFDGKTRSGQIWLYEKARSLFTRLTFDPGNHRLPAWSPDGSSVIFSSDRQGKFGLYRRASSGAGSEEVLLKSDLSIHASDWSRDGQYIAYYVNDPKTQGDLWIMPMNSTNERKPFPFLQTEFNETRANFSPDGRWVAYQSNESGTNEIYVRPFPGPASKWQVSTSGGSRPRWRKDGKELFYHGNDNKIYAAEIKLNSSTAEVGSVVPLFHPHAFVGGFRDGYDVSADGQRFLVSVLEQQTGPVTVLLNWPGEIKK